jgi:hypothetical protein
MKVSVLLNLSKKMTNLFKFIIDFLLRYGEDASILTENAAYALGNSALTAYYVGGLGPKAVRINEI